MEAEKAMLAMATEEFWEQATRENGIADMAAIEAAWRRAIRDLNDELSTADFQL
jgi:hypothetical protein